MNTLTSIGLIGVGAYLLTRGKDAGAASAVDHVTTGEDEVIVEGDVVAESPDGSEILVAGLDNGAEIQIIIGGVAHTFVKVGEAALSANGVSTPTPETAQKGAAMGSTGFMAASCYMGASKRRPRTKYTAQKWNKGKFNLREEMPINLGYPAANDCAAAGRAVAEWRWAKVRGQVRPANRNAPANVGLSAAVLASTPCEIYKKVATGEIPPEAGLVRMDNYYANNPVFDPGATGLTGSSFDPVAPTYTRTRRHDS